MIPLHSACTIGAIETAAIQPDSCSQPANSCAVCCQQSYEFSRLATDVAARLCHSATATDGYITGAWHAAAAGPFHQLCISPTTAHRSGWPGIINSQACTLQNTV